MIGTELYGETTVPKPGKIEAPHGPGRAPIQIPPCAIDALEAALDIDLAIEGAGSPDKIEFMKIARKDGLRAAIAWRDARFGKGGNG